MAVQSFLGTGEPGRNSAHTVGLKSSIILIGVMLAVRAPNRLDASVTLTIITSFFLFFFDLTFCKRVYGNDLAP